MTQFFHTSQPYITENGDTIPSPSIAFHTYGHYTEGVTPVVWICHALTANSDAADWWSGLVGAGRMYDPEKYFIVCANILGSCYGTTGPLSVNPETGKPWFRSFPYITIRDLVSMHILLRKHLNIKQVHTVIGGSIGSFQALEWCVMEPDVVQYTVLIAGNEQVRPWTVAFNEVQRMAIETDCTYQEDSYEGGAQGLKTARAMSMLGFRNYEAYNMTQPDTHSGKNYKPRAATYQQYQGEKLIRRFNAYSYHVILNLMDSNNIARNRGEVAEVLKGVKARCLVVGISSDMLFPPAEQKQLAAMLPHAVYNEIHSDFGHDGFLLEYKQLTECINLFYQENKYEL